MKLLVPRGPGELNPAGMPQNCYHTAASIPDKQGREKICGRVVWHVGDETDITSEKKSDRYINVIK